MAVTHVKLDRALSVGSDIATALNHFSAFKELILRSHAICDTARSAGVSPPDDTVFEAGILTGCLSGEGATFFGALNSIKVALLNASGSVGIIDLLANVPKLDQGSAQNIL